MNLLRCCVAEIVTLVRTLVLFHYDDDARRVQSQFDCYLRVINDAVHDVWNPSTSDSFITDMVVLNVMLRCLPISPNPISPNPRVRVRVGARVRVRVGVMVRVRVGVSIGVGVGVRIRVRVRVTSCLTS